MPFSIIETSIDLEPASPLIQAPGLRQNTPTEIAKPVRPTEFSLWVAVPFINLFVILAIALGVIYMKAHANGTSIRNEGVSMLDSSFKCPMY